LLGELSNYLIAFAKKKTARF